MAKNDEHFAPRPRSVKISDSIGHASYPFLGFNMHLC